MFKRKLEFEDKLEKHLEVTEAERKAYNLDKKTFELAKMQSQQTFDVSRY